MENQKSPIFCHSFSVVSLADTSNRSNHIGMKNYDRNVGFEEFHFVWGRSWFWKDLLPKIPFAFSSVKESKLNNSLYMISAWRLQ